MKYTSIQHAFTAALCGLLFGLTFLLASSPARAQSDAAQIEQTFKQIYALVGDGSR